ncbi:lysophospholipid acyltransferase family protein [Hydrogenophaga laconesensis]|uniref:1-acyl-sn-glycerol-3-phosphate acyltransferase n=1 Tax=Hydrogenophaga laconesensis TaxID=1805971 RepID=A0ABU1V7U1_9BURK|nr:lysophospholipid acyltransferase family protein [Hydrogenophaga laconesensis]MDR7093524.1 1-acyl-sn-glycerol-3-phosphate acyltransferase [Hydrogenophaga laconesensis]
MSTAPGRSQTRQQGEEAPVSAMASQPASLLWSVYEHIAMVLGLSSLAVICLTWTPLALALYPVLPTPLGRWLGRQAIMRGFRLYVTILRTLCACRFDLSEIDTLRDQGPMVIAANHPSLLDAVLITSRLPDAVCFMKAELMDNPLFGAGARMARYVRNDHLLSAVQICRRELEQGAQLVIFPEGTRTVGYPENPLNPLSRSTALIASRAGVPVQTLIIEFSSPYLGKGWPLWRRPSLPLTCRVRLGKRFDVPRDARAFTAELDAHFRSELDTPSTAHATSAAA